MEFLYDDNLLVSVFQVLNNIISLWSTVSVIFSSFLPAAGAPQVSNAFSYLIQIQILGLTCHQQ